MHGFFALLVISPFMQRTIGADYFNAASAIIVVAAMILPIIVSISDDAIRAVPREIKEAALGLGATRWEMATRVVLPSARSGIVAAILLALARAVGETMAVTMACWVSCCIALRPQTRGPNPDRVHRAGRNRRHTPRSSDRGGLRGGRYVVCLDIYRQHTGGWGNKEKIGREEEGGRRPCFESDKTWNSFYQRHLADSRKIECPSRSVLTIQVRYLPETQREVL